MLAVQLHPPVAITLMLPVPPLAVKDWLIGKIENPHTRKHCENSDVLPLESVAVAVINWPQGSGVVNVKLALQLESVEIVIEPMKVCPSPLPLGSQALFEKNSISNVWFGLLLSVPVIDVSFPPVMADVITGKFCN